ncbi:MAG: hypothetical protein IJ516_05660 [Phascolarctobacterium sp.]|nr:hypothetical protein [Phascolarctobacterium sp.]
MKSAIVLNADDIKKIIAEYFNVDVTDVIKSQYSYTVVGAKCKEIIKLQESQGE